MNQFQIIKFTFGDMILQEPMALITNWLIFLFCFYVFISIPWGKSFVSQKFKWFYFFMALGTFFGGLGHLFFHYTGIYGKYPSWICAVISGYLAGQAILQYWQHQSSHHFFRLFLIIKSTLLLTSSLLIGKFVFVAIDAILTYLLYCGFIAWRLWRNEQEEMKYMVFGVLILLPSAFIFLLNINIHRFLNRDDLSHLLMLACLILFYRGIKRMNLSFGK